MKRLIKPSTIMRVLLIIILIIPIVFIVAFQRNRTDNRTETLSQKEIERINLATSTDGKTLVIYKNVKISSISQGELWSKNLENGQEELLVREGMTEDYNIKNISDTTNKPIDISSIS